MRPHRLVVYLTVAAVVMIAFVYGTPPQLPAAWARRLPLIGGLPGDFPEYAWRFLLSAALLGVLPLGTALACGQRPAELGLRRPRRPFPTAFFLLFLGVILVAALLGGYDPGMAAYYPYSHTLVRRVVSGHPGLFALHALLYAVLYYLPWELLFRGLLLFPFLALVRPQGPETESGRPGLSPALLAAASLQVIPSTLLHFGHPLTEVVAAVPFGIAAGYLALRTRSILPGLLLHATVGIGQDLVIVLRAAALLPGGGP